MTEFNEVPKIENDMLGSATFDGERVAIDSVINKEVAIIDFMTAPSSFYEGFDFAAVQFMEEDNLVKWFRTGSKVLIEQLKKLKDNNSLPIRTKLVKVKRYITMAPV